ncbi:MAG: aryl-sulfate sulfotransferase [Bacteroidota bacterium]
MRYWMLGLALWMGQWATAQQTVGLFFNDSLAQDGYTLWTPNRTTYLVDNCGRLVRQWESDYSPGLSVYLLEDGSLLRAGRENGVFNSAGVGGRIEKFSWEGDLRWAYSYTGPNWHQHHDIEPLPGGNVLVAAWERKIVEQARQAGSDQDREYWPLHIVELQPVGTDSAEIVWEWHLWDHLIQDHDPTRDNYGPVREHPELVDLNFLPPQGGFSGADWLHTNAIDYNPLRDEILISARDLSEILIIDHSTTSTEAAGHTGGRSGRGGDLLYRWGNPQSYRRQGPEAQRFFLQHDARWIPPGHPRAGQIMVFNNGRNRPDGFYSSVDIISPPLDANGRYQLDPGKIYGPAELAWTYPADPQDGFYSGIMSGAHPLPNGNYFICVSDLNLFIEVTEAGEEVWRYVNPIGSNGPVAQGQLPPFTNVFRATRYPGFYPAFEARDLTPGEALELDPLPLDCQRFSVATQTPAAAPPVVRVQQNPFGEELQLHKATSVELELSIYQLDGRLRYRGQWEATTLRLSTDHWPDGFYLIHVRNPKNGQVAGIKIVKA